MKVRTWHTAILAVGLAGGLPAQIPDFTPATPLIGALMHNDTAEAKRLLANGANPNEEHFLYFTPVFLPVIYQNREVLHAMIDKGADVTARDATGATLLMWAAVNENADTALVEDLLKLGIDVNATNQAGESALTWASRRGETRVVSILRKAGASDAATIRSSAERAIALLQKSSPQFVRVSGCVSCHSQVLPEMAIAAARTRGLTVDEKASAFDTQASAALFKSVAGTLTTKDRFPDPAVSVSYGLLGLNAGNYPADELTDGMTNLIAQWQDPDGGFKAFPMRPPIESSHFAATALSLRSLQLYGKNSEEQVTRARTWLLNNTPRTNEDRVMQLLGLGWSNAAPEQIAARSMNLMAEQRPDGGWGQLPGLESDAYATGQALVALNMAAKVRGTDPAYRRGVAFLLRTQFADGSWLVRSRTFPVQPYKESGFPYGKDQWISAAGTSWAAMALSLALPPLKEEHFSSNIQGGFGQ